MIPLLPRAAATLATALLVALGAALPASAHAALVSTDPADGAVVATAPTSLTLEFNETIGEQFAVVTLTGAAGTQLELPAPGVDGTTVTQSVPALDAGAWTMAYRVVSEDGHPIQGSSGFTVEAAAPTAPTTTTAAAAAIPTTSAEPSVETAAAVVDDDGAGVPTWILVGAPLLLVGAAVAVAVNRRRSRP